MYKWGQQSTFFTKYPYVTLCCFYFFNYFTDILLYIEKKLELIGIKYIAQCTKTDHQTLFPMSTDQGFAFLHLGSVVPGSWGGQGWTMIYKCWHFLSDWRKREVCIELTHSLNTIAPTPVTGRHCIQMQSCKLASRTFLVPNALKVHHVGQIKYYYVCPSYFPTYLSLDWCVF